MKKCPYCAELIQEEAVFCRFCRRDLPQSPPSRQHDSEPDHWLPPGYVPPEDGIAAAYHATLARFRDGGWSIVAEPSWIPIGIHNPRQYAAFLRELAEKAWNQGGRTPEGAVEWLTSFNASRSPVKSLISSQHSDEATWAAKSALSTYASYTQAELRRSFLIHLDSLVHKIQRSSHSKAEAETLLDPLHESLDNDVPLHLRPLLYQEARRLLPSLEITGEHFVVPLSQRPGFGDDLDSMRAKAFAIIEERYGGNVSPRSGFKGMLNEDEYALALTDAIDGDVRYADGGAKAIVSLGVRSMLKEHGYAVLPEESIRRHRIR